METSRVYKCILYNDMLWVVMNMLCFVSFLHMVCWNLHMPGVEIYTSSVNVVLMVCWNLCIPAFGKNWNLHIAWLFSLNLVWIWTQNVGCHCIIVIKHGLLCFVTLMHGWACIDYGPQLACGKLDGPSSFMPTHALTFTKHRHPMFNYYSTVMTIRTIFTVAINLSKLNLSHISCLTRSVAWTSQVLNFIMEGSCVFQKLTSLLLYICEIGQMRVWEVGQESTSKSTRSPRKNWLMCWAKCNLSIICTLFVIYCISDLGWYLCKILAKSKSKVVNDINISQCHTTESKYTRICWRMD